MYKPVLSAEQRRFLLDLLSEEANDDLLISAAQETLEARRSVHTDMAAIARARGTNPYSLLGSAPKDSETNERLADLGDSLNTLEARQEKAAELSAKAKPNVEPDGEAATRIKKDTQELIIRGLQSGHDTPAKINTYINGRIQNTHRLLKLLWQRKQIGYNGKTYFIL